MPSYKLKGPGSKPAKTFRKHSRKLLVKQFGGGEINKSILFELAINKTSQKGSGDLQKLDGDVLSKVPDLANSGYIASNLLQTKYVVIEKTKQKQSFFLGPQGPKTTYFVVQINPKPTKDNMNVYFVDETDDAISLTAGFPVLKKLTPFGKETLVYTKFEKEADNFSNAIILDIDGVEKQYKSSSLYTTKVIQQVNKFSKGRSIHTTSGGHRAATPHELKKLNIMMSVVPHSKIVKPSTAASGAARGAAAAAGAAGPVRNIISRTDLQGLFPVSMSRGDAKNVSDIVEKLYDFNNSGSFGGFDNMTNIIKHTIGRNEFYLAEKLKRDSLGNVLNITTLKNDYYILKKFYGRDDILVICVMPRRDADDNINLGSPEIYEDSNDLVIDFDGTNYSENNHTFFNRSHVLLSCLKEYIKLDAVENADQSKLDSYDGYYISRSLLRTHLKKFFLITQKLQFNTSSHGYYYLYDINNGDIYKILTDNNQHRQKVAVIVKINPNDKDMFFMENFQVAPNDEVLIYYNGTQPQFPAVELFATGPPYSSIYSTRIP